jgi:hypothetical protein
MIIREAGPDDGPTLVRFFLETPMRAGTEFVFDRSPDFGALLRLRGRHRTFVALSGQTIAGSITALWHEGYDGDRTLRVGEIIDLRVATWARGGTLTARLLAAARDAFSSERTDWVVCLIGENNRDALGLVAGKAGFPPMRPLARYASAHFPAFRLPAAAKRGGVHVRTAGPQDAELLMGLAEELDARRPFRPPHPFPWPDPTGQHQGWIAVSAEGRPLGALITWDGMSVRRIRVVRYSVADQLFRVAMAVAARVGAAQALPAPGGPIRLWASRWFGVVESNARAARMLVRTALRAASLAGQHVLQVNLAEDDPLCRTLPALPHSVYSTIVYACPIGAGGEATLLDDGAMCFADLALV